jgi:hypothetical protein
MQATLHYMTTFGGCWLTQLHSQRTSLCLPLALYFTLAIVCCGRENLFAYSLDNNKAEFQMAGLKAW